MEGWAKRKVRGGFFMEFGNWVIAKFVILITQQPTLVLDYELSKSPNYQIVYFSSAMNFS
jgi:hypothetical protein